MVGIGGREPEEPAAGPGADREQHRPEDRAQLEGDVVGDDPPADGDEDIGEREVEGVERQAVVPARVPAGEMAVAQQRLEVLGHRDVRARVATRRRRVREQHAGVQLREGHDDHAGDGDHRDGTRHPPPAGSGSVVASGAAGPASGGSCTLTAPGSGGFRHDQPRARQGGSGRPRLRSRSATSGLRYRRDPRARARVTPTGEPELRRNSIAHQESSAVESRRRLRHRAAASTGSGTAASGSSARRPRQTG